MVVDKTSHTNDELADLVDAGDNVIGQEWRSVAYENNMMHQLRGVWFFIKNDKGQLWIARRSAHKSTYPLALDGSAVGLVGAGETYDQSVKREVLEELNIDLNRQPFTLLGYGFAPGFAASHVRVYQMISNDIPPFNKDDIAEGLWLYPKELLDLYKKGEPMKPTLPRLVMMFFAPDLFCK